MGCFPAGDVIDADKPKDVVPLAAAVVALNRLPCFPAFRFDPAGRNIPAPAIDTETAARLYVFFSSRPANHLPLPPRTFQPLQTFEQRNRD